jgi:hypothetical protein
VSISKGMYTKNQRKTKTKEIQPSEINRFIIEKKAEEKNGSIKKDKNSIC